MAKWWKEADQRRPQAEARAVRMSVVRELPIQWLWPGRIVSENLTLLVGEPDVGKSTVAFDLAARLASGGDWPDGTPIGEPKSTLFVSAEDHASFTVLPALATAGADLGYISTIWDVQDEKKGVAFRRPFELPRDMNELATKVGELPNCKLVVIDPITAIVRPTNLRNTLRELVMLSGDLQLALLGLAHLRPGGMWAMYRTDGGIALTSAARAVWLVTTDPTREERRLLLPVKNNLVRERTGLAFSAVNEGERVTPHLKWERDKVETRVDAVLAAQRRFGMEAGRVQEAIKFLTETLAAGPRLVTEVEREARRECGVSHRTLVRARKAAGVQTYKGSEGWWMFLPLMGVGGPIHQNDGTVGTVGTLPTNHEENSGNQECLSVPTGTVERKADG